MSCSTERWRLAPRLVIRAGIAAAAIAVVLPGGVGAVAYALPKSAPVTQCQLITGPRWRSPSQSASSKTYTVNVIGHAFSCKVAMAWAAKLVKDPAKSPSGLPLYHFALNNGPPGYTCAASADREGLAYSGICFKGPVLNPTKGLAWGGVL